MEGIKGKKISHKGEDNCGSCIKKERHLVAWSSEEDDILREKIGLLGTDSWTMIASWFKDKTPRQCRRRWYTYLNSDFKKGGWTPEEDVLLCEAQRRFGNRWTEIAKVVSGRTDNAVKNRFTTLCRRRARLQASEKENNFTLINLNNKRVIPSLNSGTEGVLDDIPIPKRERQHSRGWMKTYDLEDSLHVPKKALINQSSRSPLAVLEQNYGEQNSMKLEISTAMDNEYGNKIRGTYLGKDDPKIAALKQQEALLCSLAVTVNEESTNRTIENAWKVLEDFLNQNKDGVLDKENAFDLHYQGDGFRGLVKGSRRIEDRIRNQIHEPVNLMQHISSECSSGSTADQLLVSNQTSLVDKREQTFDSTNAVFSSPLQVTPLFRSVAAEIPSPKFSESERNFIMKTLGVESPSAAQSAKPPQHPTCKRALLQQL